MKSLLITTAFAVLAGAAFATGTQMPEAGEKTGTAEVMVPVLDPAGAAAKNALAPVIEATNTADTCADDTVRDADCAALGDS